QISTCMRCAGALLTLDEGAGRVHSDATDVSPIFGLWTALPSTAFFFTPEAYDPPIPPIKSRYPVGCHRVRTVDKQRLQRQAAERCPSRYGKGHAWGTAAYRGDRRFLPN